MRKILNVLTIVIVVSLLVLNPIGVNAGDNGSTALGFDGTDDYVDANNNGG
jgi:hypothetical protein